MNETTLFLSRLIGPTILLIGISFAIHHKFYIDWFKKFKEREPLLFFTELIEIIAGLAIILSHNLWTSVPEIIISVIGYGMVLEGALVLLVGKPWVNLAVRLFSRTTFLFVFSLLLTVLTLVGGYLTWIGYFV